MRTLGVALAALALGLMSCDPRAAHDVPPVPDNVVQRDTFVLLHARLQLLEAAYRQHMLKGDRDRARARYRAFILDDAGVTDSAFTATYEWWYSQPEALPPLLEEVQSHLDSMERNSEWN